MNAELRAMFEYYLFDQPGSYYGLLTNQSSFATGTIVPSLYGVGTWDGTSTPPTHVGGQRAGFLTTAAILTSGGTISHPFVTGGLVHKHILCREFGNNPEPTFLPALNSESEELITTRVRYENLVPRGSSCMNCHSSIEAVGMPFQAYDVFGRYRYGQEQVIGDDGTYIGQVSINTTQTPVVNHALVPVTDAVDLVSKFATTSEPQTCFVKQYLRFANARKDSVRDSCVEFRFAQHLQNGTMWDAIKNYIADDWFTKRRLE